LLPQQVAAGAQQLGAAAGAQQEGAAAGAQAIGAGAAQAGAQAAGAAHVGAQAAGAAQVGAAEQQLGAGAQQLARLPNRPASALFRLAKHTRAAVIQANFISKLLNIQAVGNVRPTPSQLSDTSSIRLVVDRKAFASLTLDFGSRGLERLEKMK
jgi:hypothetical protein